MVKVDDLIIVFIFKPGDEFADVFGKEMDFVYVGIVIDERGECFFSEKVNFGVELIFEDARDGGGEDDVTDGGEADEEAFFFHVWKSEDIWFPLHVWRREDITVKSET